MSDYAAQLDAIVAALQAINPDRVVTREYQDFANRAQSTLQAGVWSVLPGGVKRYAYEVSDNGGPTDSLRATEHGTFVVTIVGQLLLPEDCTGVDVDNAEFAMLQELEALADAAMDTPGIEALQLLDAQMSGQLERPYAWVTSTWETFPL